MVGGYCPICCQRATLARPRPYSEQHRPPTSGFAFWSQRCSLLARPSQQLSRDVLAATDSSNLPMPRCGRDWELLYAEGTVSVRSPLLDQSYDQTDHRQCRYAPIDVKVTFIASEQETQDEAAAEKDQPGIANRSQRFAGRRRNHPRRESSDCRALSGCLTTRVLREADFCGRRGRPHPVRPLAPLERTSAMPHVARSIVPI